MLMIHLTLSPREGFFCEPIYLDVDARFYLNQQLKCELICDIFKMVREARNLTNDTCTDLLLILDL